MLNQNVCKCSALGACLIALLAGISSCDNGLGTAANSNESISKQENSRVAQVMTSPDQEQVALLAIKYGISSDSVEKLLNTYQSKTDANFNLQIFPDKNTYTQALTDAASMSGVPIKTAAAIVEEYEIWDETQNIQAPQ